MGHHSRGGFHGRLPSKLESKGLCPEGKERMKSKSHPAEENRKETCLFWPWHWVERKKKNLTWESAATSWSSQAFQFEFTLLVWFKQTQLENLKWPLLGCIPSQLAEANSTPALKNSTNKCQPYRMSTNTVPEKGSSSQWKIINFTRRKREPAGTRSSRNRSFKAWDLKLSYAD